MGEVFRADDLKLGQPVAIKLLPEQLQNDPGRLQRFLNEVRVALQVTHPNVCRVYDIGEIEGTHYLSMEYIDGEDSLLYAAPKPVRLRVPVGRPAPHGMIATWWLINFFRVGLLSLIVGLGLVGVAAPTTPGFDPTRFYSAPYFLFLAIFAATAIYGFYVSLAGQPMFQDVLETAEPFDPGDSG